MTNQPKGSAKERRGPRIGRGRAALLLAIWSIVGAALLLAGLEGALRLVAPGESTESANAQPPWMDDDTFQLWRAWVDRLGVPISEVADVGWRHDPELRWGLKPNASMTARNIFVDERAGSAAHWRLETNEYGFRTDAYTIEKDPEALRVVTLGDSNTMGWLLNREDTYAERLEVHLADRTGLSVEVINLGIGGYTSYGARRLFDREVTRLRPDVLVLSIGANDPQKMNQSDAEFARLNRSWLPGGFRNWMGQLELTRAMSRLLRDEEQNPTPRVSPEAYGENLAHIFAAAERLGIPVVFLEVCCCAPAYSRRLDAQTDRYGIPVVRTQPLMARALHDERSAGRFAAQVEEISGWYAKPVFAKHPNLRFYFRDFCHLNPLGSEIVGETLARQVVDTLGR